MVQNNYWSEERKLPSYDTCLIPSWVKYLIILEGKQWTKFETDDTFISVNDKAEI
jgi:hypothetical protein